MEVTAMHRIVHYLMIFLMILWTALLIADLVQGFLGGGVLATAPADQTPVQTAQWTFQALLPDLWSPAAQARAIVWGLPMTVFSLIAAITQR
jgi:hypothetical protein